MGRQREPIVKLSRREGVNLAETPKVQKYMERRPYPPGQHGQRRGRKISDYGCGCVKSRSCADCTT